MRGGGCGLGGGKCWGLLGVVVCYVMLPEWGDNCKNHQHSRNHWSHWMNQGCLCEGKMMCWAEVWRVLYAWDVCGFPMILVGVWRARCLGWTATESLLLCSELQLGGGSESGSEKSSESSLESSEI